MQSKRSGATQACQHIVDIGSDEVELIFKLIGLTINKLPHKNASTKSKSLPQGSQQRSPRAQRLLASRLPQGGTLQAPSKAPSLKNFRKRKLYLKTFLCHNRRVGKTPDCQEPKNGACCCDADSHTRAHVSNSHATVHDPTRWCSHSQGASRGGCSLFQGCGPTCYHHRPR